MALNPYRLRGWLLAAATITSTIIAFVFRAQIASGPALSVFKYADKKQTAPPERYFFIFGDSYTTRVWPNGDPLPIPFESGDASLPGVTAAIGPNWIDTVIVNSPVRVKSYNYAMSGAIVDFEAIHVNMTGLTDIVSFKHQAQNFTNSDLAHPRTSDGTMSSVPWTPSNTLFICWFGINSIFLTTRPDEHISNDDLITGIMRSYFDIVDELIEAGARQFLFLGVGPLERYPTAKRPEFANGPAKGLLWNEQLRERTLALDNSNDEVSAAVFDTTPFFNEVMDHPEKYGAANATCESKTAYECVWGDHIHPGTAIHDVVGEGVLKWLNDSGFFDTASEGKTAIEP